MRLHTNTLTTADVHAALKAEKTAGRIARSVHFKVIREHRSNAANRGIEVQLESVGKAPGDGRRYGNSGAYGRGDNYSATFDEWGYLLSALYELDRDMIVGSPTTPTYAGRTDFHEKTGLSYSDERYQRAAEAAEGNDPYPFVIGRRSGTAGRKGAGRVDGERLPNYMWREAVASPGKLISGYVCYSPRS